MQNLLTFTPVAHAVTCDLVHLLRLCNGYKAICLFLHNLSSKAFERLLS